MLKRYLFILGRDSELSKLELFALLNRLNIKFSINQNSKEFVVFDIDNFNSQQFINYSGGIVKIAEKIDLKNYFYEGTEKNINYGISILGNPGEEFINKTISILKNKYHEEKLKASIKTPKFRLFAPLDIKTKSLEDFIILNKEIYKTKTISEPYLYKERDDKRPEKNFVVQTSIRLAKILVNISNAKTNLLDPFCGYGTILQEAMLNNLDVYGFELDEKVSKACIKNLEWIKSKYKLNSKFNIYNFPNSRVKRYLNPKSIDAVVTEPNMGPYFVKVPSQSKAISVMQELERSYSILFDSLPFILKKDSLVVILIPELRSKAGKIRLNIKSIIKSSFIPLSEKYGVKLPLRIKGQVFDRYLYILKPI